MLSALLRPTAALWAGVVLFAAGAAQAAGTLTPVGSPDAPIQIRDHHAQVVIQNGFARTEVTQTFFNPNATDLEGIYAFPIPRSASLSEMTVFAGELQIDGEVVAREQAERIYQEEKSRGEDAGLASKNGYQTFEFRVTPIRARAETRVRFVYYQPLEIDTGVGRYLYPLEDGGTDEIAKSFWLTNARVEGHFSAEIELKSAWPVSEVRAPGFEDIAEIEELGPGHTRVRIDRQGASLDRDLVFYYRLQDGLPGRVEVIPYRPDPNEPGTFMMVVTPGLDLGPIEGGRDFAFVLDVSGSMAGKIRTLAHGVSKALGELDPDDRYRIITFESRARELSRGWQAATPDNVAATLQALDRLGTGGSTNLYEGLELGFDSLDADRATSVILVTDSVTNTGVVEPKAFHALMQEHDVRLFGFLMGNSGNWPLMRLITETSGGFYAQVSNADDVIGQILLAKGKVTHEALHAARLRIRGVKTFDTTGQVVGKVYRGQQLVLFGRYAEAGEARLSLEASLTGEDKTYSTSFDFPEVATDHPEIERLWALARIEELEALALSGLMDGVESEDAIRDLGVEYQLVTDETSMLVLADEAFERHGIERRNRDRVAVERAARSRRQAQPVRSHRVDERKPAFDLPSPSIGGGGGGAIDPMSGLLLLAAGAAAWRGRRNGNDDGDGRDQDPGRS
ncbi:MAG: MprA protease, GlyGly-CTERM protein-sorting domain-containing form [Myxococcota bacterium]